LKVRCSYLFTAIATFDDTLTPTGYPEVKYPREAILFTRACDTGGGLGLPL